MARPAPQPPASRRPPERTPLTPRTEFFSNRPSQEVQGAASGQWQSSLTDPMPPTPPGTTTARLSAPLTGYGLGATVRRLLTLDSTYCKLPVSFALCHRQPANPAQPRERSPAALGCAAMAPAPDQAPTRAPSGLCPEKNPVISTMCDAVAPSQGAEHLPKSSKKAPGGRRGDPRKLPQSSPESPQRLPRTSARSPRS
jgi:hypothetical protein